MKTPLFLEVECWERGCGGCDCRYHFEGEHECGAFDVAIGKYDDGLPNRCSECRRAESIARAYRDVVEAVLTSGADFGECVAVALDKLREAKGE